MKGPAQDNGLADTGSEILSLSDLTPPGTDFGDGDHREVPLVPSRTLQPGHTYVIQSVSCGRQMRLLDDKVVLGHHDSLGSPFWRCEEDRGWLGLRHAASGKFLRHGGGQPGFYCSNPGLGLWERLQIRPHPDVDGGCVLLSEFWWGYRPVGIITHNGQEMLSRIEPDGDALAWIFLEVR